MLLSGVIYLEPIAIGILQINLVYAVGAGGHLLFVARPIFKRNASLLQLLHKSRHRTHGKTHMTLFDALLAVWSFNEVQRGRWGNAQPAVQAIPKRFGQGIEANDLGVKGAAGIQVFYHKGYMVEANSRCGLLAAAGASRTAYKQEGGQSEAKHA